MKTVQVNAKAENDSAKEKIALHATTIKIEKQKMLLPKVQNPAKKEKPSRAERGYSDARGPKKKDDWQEFFKDKEPDFSEEGWARRKPKK